MEQMEQNKYILLNNIKLNVFSDGKIYKVLEDETEVFLNNKPTINGYVACQLKNKKFYQHRIIGYAFLNLDIENIKIQIDHKNLIKTDNRVENLRVVNNQQNNWNLSNVKGYTLCKKSKKYVTQIRINGKKTNIGSFKTEEEAHNAYLKAKEKYHPIPENSIAV